MVSYHSDRWQHLRDAYGVFDADEARERCGGDELPEEALGFGWDQGELFPAFQFDACGASPVWREAMQPLVQAAWEPEDILAWMVSPNGRLGGREPASLLTTDARALCDLVVEEAKGVW